MADITLLGATYTGVPAVDLPKSGGGTARFYENTGITIDLLWTNSSPTSSFSAQTLNFSGTYYGYLILFWASNQAGIIFTDFLQAGVSHNIGAPNFNGGIFYRTVTTTSSSVQFGTGDSNDNARIIPYYIFGIQKLN